MVYLVSYDLNRPGQDYGGLYDAIKALGDWCHPLESTWLIDTTLGASPIAERLRANIDRNDSLLVIGVTQDYAGWLPKEVWEWIRGRSAALSGIGR
ncbi:MAG: hypothetical protein KC591_05720 [Gemmatimonadetes bacterium]|nr:hypothetical protein [Gemmatimonadota bacterium]